MVRHPQRYRPTQSLKGDLTRARSLTSACSWRAGPAPGAAPAQRSDVALWSKGLCGYEHDGPQLMRGTLGGRPRGVV